MHRRLWYQVLLVVLTIGALIYAYFVMTARPARAHPWTEWAEYQRRPLVFAHQGGEGVWPSNTMLAFRNANALGVDVLDTDMHMSKDGVLVLMHDETVDRTTDGHGAIRDLTLAQLKALDAGYRFSLDGGATYPFRGQDARIPTLEEVFDAFPGQHFGVELKQVTPAAAQAFCQVIRKHGMQEKVLVSSFGQENMNAFRSACPEVATSGTQDEVTVFFALQTLRLERAYSPKFDSLQVPESEGPLTILNQHFIDAARGRGLAVQPWTINEPEEMRRILALDVDGINTDYPGRLLELMTKR